MCELVLVAVVSQSPDDEEEIIFIVEKPETDPSGFNAQYGYE